MVKFSEIKIKDFKISDITKDSEEKNGIGDITFIRATSDKPKELELVFEVGSSVDDPQKIGLKGQDMPNPNKRGYAVIFNFKNLGKEVKPETLKDFILSSECKVHCDCNSFYYQGMQQANSQNGNTKFKFQGTGGKNIWSLRHSDKNGTPGKSFCKHLDAVRDWLLKDSNLETIKEALPKPQKEKDSPEKKEESLRKQFYKVRRMLKENLK